MKSLLVIEGPTASGKTQLSIALAKHFNTSIVSADSRQFYKELSIGTAKPTITERDGIVHHFIDSHSLVDEVNSGQFEKEGLLVLEDEFKSNNVVILTGGSGMFIDALCLGLDPIPSSEKIRKELTDDYEKMGLNHLLDELKKSDLNYFEKVDRHNPYRVIRAIEVIRLTGKPYSEFRKSTPKKRPFEICRYVINHDRSKLYERINERVDRMMEQGLLEEVKSLRQFQSLTSLRTVGYQELFEFLEGISELNEAIEKIKRNSRRYAKRQLTWFRRHSDAVWIDYENDEQLKNEVITHFNSINA